MSSPFRERNPSIDRGDQPRRHRAADAGRVPRPGPAADRRRRHLLRRVLRVRRAQGRRRGPDRRRPGRQGRDASSSTATTSRSTFRVDTDSELRRRRPAPRSRSRRCSARCTSSLEPAGSGQLAEGAEIPVERTSSPYDVVDAFSGLAETSEQIDTDQLAQVADHARRPDPQHPRGVPRRARRASPGSRRTSPRATTRSTPCCRTSTGSPTVLDDRDEDIVGLMKDSDVLFRALVARRERGPQPAGVDAAASRRS